MQNIFKRHKCLCTLAIVLSLVGVILLLLASTLYNYIIDNELVLSENKHTYKLWKKTPIPITLDFYFFNWSNPEDVRNVHIKPKLEEIGPYVFRETKEKVDIVWNSNGTVSYRQLRRWYFDQEKSNGTLNDFVTTLNPVGVTAAAQSKYLNYIIQKGLSMSMKSLMKDVYITKTVGEFLFDGYNDNLINVARNMPKLPGVEMPPFDKFGWFYLRNGSTDFDGLMTMGTGTNDIPLGTANRWNNAEYTDFYEGECGKVYGSAGELWPQHITKDDIYLFSPDMCRAVGFQFEKEVDVKGIKGYKFIGGEKSMDNGTKYPENRCFCGGECVPSGLLNVTSCRYGAPGFISFPHFFAADSYYVNQFEGLKPDREKHELHVTLEPRTGIPLSVSAKFQINLLMVPNPEIGLYSDVPKLYFPMIWFRQEVEIPDDMAGELKQLLNLPYTATVFATVMIVLGVSVLLTFISIYLFRKFYIIRINNKLKTTQFTKETIPLNENGINSIIVIKQVNDKLKSNHDT